MQVGIFGGTFDPPHNGHIELAKKMIENTKLDKIIFVPAANPPHKPGQPITPFIHRLKMLQFAMLGIKNFETSDIEFSRMPNPSYTIDTMEELQKKYPGSTLFLIIGEDSLNQLHTWHKAQKLAERWKIITYPRKNENISEEILLKNWSKNLAKKLYKSIIPLPVFPFSSSEIRTKIKNKENLTDLLNQQVIDYIIKHHLYNS